MLRLIFLMYEQVPFPQLFSIFRTGPSFNNTDGPANCVIFDNDMSPAKFEKKSVGI